MYEQVDDGREITTRKSFSCEWCGELIEKGSKAIMRKYVWDGNFNNERQHPECYEAMNESINDGSLDEDGFTQGEMFRGKTATESEEHVW